MSQAMPLDRLSLDALKSLGKTLGQMTLYKIGHPSVSATLKTAEDHLTEALSQTQGELAFSIDQDKIIANGRIIAGVRELPSSIAQFFSRFKLASVTFKAGLNNEDLVAFCELAAVRPGAGAVQAAPAAYFKEKGITRIIFNEAVYTKRVGEDDALEQGLKQKSLDKTIRGLVERAVPETERQKEVLSRVIELLEADIEKRVGEVTKKLRDERTVLQNEQSRTKNVLENMVEGVVMVDEQGKILMMNPAAEEIYGATLAEVAGLPIAAKAREEHLVTIASEVATPSDREIKKDVAVTGGDETKRTIRASGAVVQNQEGKVVGMVSQLSDVAKHKEAQRMQRDFIAHVTHELRAPLSSIRAALEILQGEVADKIKDDESRMLGTALKNADRLGDLINSILDFSKIESGQMAVFPKKCDAEKIAREGVDSLGAWAAKKRVNLSLVVSDGLPPIAADSARSVQVLINLISNAIKFTPIGGYITVRLGMAADSVERQVQYSVTDTGPGIAKPDQKRIFEKFVQIAAGELHVGGTGLGLAIAKALVHLQSGKMWVESEPGKGATFFFTLPVYSEAKDGAATPKPAARLALPWWKRLLGLKK